MSAPTPHRPSAPRRAKKESWPPLEKLGFWNIAEREPRRPALLLPDGTARSFGQLRSEANRLSHGLRALGLVPGDCVAALLRNDAHAYSVRLAALQSGFYFTPLNHHLTGSEIAYVLGDAEARVLIADERYAESARLAADACGVIDSARR